MDLKGSQMINCNVESCKYNEGASYCTLEAIQVAPHNSVHSGDAGEESLCASYESK
ncbi:MAG: DUF1540 domain-containing protein [Syntrophomonadaceae bacterium]|nr:DUF1540 domain-containing protein [Syntrophomonadaceae bacterium]MDD3022297.1 DUF1540 domain-containing protein [Syntrophomonadaceae bacterium]